MNETLSLRDRNLRYALLKAVADWINEELEAEKTQHRTELTERYDEDGVKSFDVKLPDGQKVATISLSVSNPSTAVTDKEALLAWAVENAPWLYEEVEHPAVPWQAIPAQEAWTERVLDPKRITELLAEVKPADPASGGPVVDSKGVLVDGLTYTPGGTPRSFSTRYAPTGREEIARAYHNGVLSHLVDGTVLPAIGAGEPE